MDAKTQAYQLKLARGTTTIGIDIGTSSVNVAQVAFPGGKPLLIRTAVVPIAGEPGENNDGRVAQALKEALAGFDLKRAVLTCVINCAQTSVRRVFAPQMSAKDLRGAVELEVRRSIPFPLSEAVLAFQVVDKFVDKNVTRLGVLAVAVPRSTLQRLENFFVGPRAKPLAGKGSVEAEGPLLVKPLNVQRPAFIPLALCLENIMRRSRLRLDETLVTIEMGTLVTELNIYRNARLQFSRKILFSSEEVTRSLTDALVTEKGRIELTFQEAEKIKQEYGIPRIETNVLIDGRITTNQVLSLIRPKIEQLAMQIDRSFDFYREEMRGGTIDRIVLFGGGARLKGLPEFLSKELETSVTLGDPLEDIALISKDVIAAEGDEQRLVLAIGAALSAGQGLTLSAGAQEPVLSGQGWPRLLTGVAALCLGLLIAGPWVYLQLKVQRLERVLAKHQSAVADVSPVLKERVARQALWSSVTARPSWDHIFRMIAEATPRSLVLTMMEWGPEGFVIKGVMQDQKDGASEDIARLLKDLEKGPLVDVRLISMNRIDPVARTLALEIHTRVEVP